MVFKHPCNVDLLNLGFTIN